MKSHNQIVWPFFKATRHLNIRYLELSKRLSKLEPKPIPLIIWRPLASIHYRMGSDFKQSKLWKILLRFYSGQYKYMFCTTEELPFITQFNGIVIVDDDDPEFNKQHLNLINQPNVACVVTTTDLLRDRLIAEGLEKDCIVIPSGVDFSSINFRSVAEIQKKYKNEPNAIVVGFAMPFICTDDEVGTDVEELKLRSVGFLLESMVPVWRKHPNLQLWLIGYPSDGVKKIANYYPQIKLIGYIQHDDILNYYQNFDIALYPRMMDVGGRHSIKLLEYMACGKPIVTTNVAESFLVFQANAGLICSNVDEFTKCLITLVNNKQLRNRLGINGKNFSRNYDWRVIAKDYQEKVFDVYTKSKY